MIMSTPKILFAAAVVVLLSTLTCVQPSTIRSMNLSDVLNRTVCPIRVEFNEDEDRIPRRIKMMKCAAEQNHWCRHNKVPAHECCRHYNERHRLACVEMRDTVLVYYKTSRRSERLEVAVGCSCIVDNPTQAQVMDPNWT